MDSLSLDDTLDGVIPSQIRGTAEGQATFLAPPNSSVGLGGGFVVPFPGGEFTTNNKELITILDRLSQRGTGIHRLPETPAQLQVQAQAADELAAVAAAAAAETAKIADKK